jgi:hypothetical protein
VIDVSTEAMTNAQNMNLAVAAMHVAALQTVPQTVAHPWLDLPISAAAKRRAELQRLSASIDKLKRKTLDAAAQFDETYGMGLRAHSEYDEVSR